MGLWAREAENFLSIGNLDCPKLKLFRPFGSFTDGEGSVGGKGGRNGPWVCCWWGEWDVKAEKVTWWGVLSCCCRLFDLDPDLLPLFQYNCKQFASPQECLSAPEFLDHIRKVRGCGTAGAQLP